MNGKLPGPKQQLVQNEGKSPKEMKHFEIIKPLMHKKLLGYHNKTAFLSGAAIPLSIAGVIALKNQNGEVVNQYKELFLFGIVCFLLALLCGVFTKAKLNALKLKLGNKDTEKLTKEAEEELNSLSSFTKTTKQISPITFYLGILSVLTYFVVQLFDFDFI